jgi:DNA-binding transcriptional MocR family regulator
MIAAEWVAALGLVAASTVTGVFGVVLTRLRSENTEQHGIVANGLDRLEGKVDVVQGDITGLTVWTRVHEEHHKLTEKLNSDGA